MLEIHAAIETRRFELRLKTVWSPLSQLAGFSELCLCLQIEIKPFVFITRLFICITLLFVFVFIVIVHKNFL